MSVESREKDLEATNSFPLIIELEPPTEYIGGSWFNVKVTEQDNCMFTQLEKQYSHQSVWGLVCQCARCSPSVIGVEYDDSDLCRIF